MAQLVIVERVKRVVRRVRRQLGLFADAPPAQVDREPEPPRLLTAQEYQTRKSLLDDSEVLVLDSIELLFRDAGKDRLPLRKWLIRNEGIKPRTAERRLEALCRAGLLLVAEPGGGRGNATVYALAYQSPGPRQIRNPVKAVVVFGRQNPDTNPDTVAAAAALSPYTEAEAAAEAAGAEKPDNTVGVSLARQNPDTDDGVSAPDPTDALVLAHYPTTRPNVLARIRANRERAGVTEAEYAELVAAHGARLRAECGDPVLWSLRICDELPTLRAAQERKRAPAVGAARPASRATSQECTHCGGTGFRPVSRGAVQGVEPCTCRRTRR
jgi:hypothetical protein